MARGSVLQKIKPLHPELKPPPGAIPWGRSADGKHQLYKMVSKRSRAVPRLVNTPEAKAREEELRAQGKTVDEIGQIMTEEGFRVYRKNQQTGEIAYPLNRPLLFDHEEIFYLVSDGHGNVYKEQYRVPTEAELAADRRRLAIERLGGGRLAELMVDEGISPEDVVAGIKARAQAPNGNGQAVESAPVAESAPEPEQPKAPTYPRKLGGGWWQLSSGEKVQGSKEEAEKAEESLPEEVRTAAAEARADAEAVPEI